MREILFRGKRLENGEWVEGAFCPKNSEGDIPCIIVYNGTLAGWWFEVAPATFGQFTGLLDKNGKRIFEGDIVRKTGGPELKPPIGKVVFENGAFLWAYRNFKLAPFVKSEAIPGYGIFDYQYEIIGNIHDNPELVEGE